MDDMEREIKFFKTLIDGVENSNHAAEQAMAKAYDALHVGPWQTMETAPLDRTRVLLWAPPYGPSTGFYQENVEPHDSRWIMASILNREAEPTLWMLIPAPNRTHEAAFSVRGL